MLTNASNAVLAQANAPLVLLKKHN
jgi:hypothetical protein